MPSPAMDSTEACPPVPPNPLTAPARSPVCIRFSPSCPWSMLAWPGRRGVTAMGALATAEAADTE